MIIRSAGFVDSSLIGSRNALNFAYILYLVLRKQGLDKGDIEYQVRRWFVMSILLGRYSSSPETMFNYDVRQIHEQGIDAHAASIIKGELSEAYWETTLPRELNTSVASSPYFRIFRAAQVKLDDHGFLSKDIKVRELVEVKSDIHHIFPRDYLKKRGLSRGQYNQVANYAITQSEINIAIGNKEPQLYFTELPEQCNGGPKKYGNITSLQELHNNYKMNCLPQGMEKMTINDYPKFLQQRRQLMAQKIKQYFFSL